MMSQPALSPYFSSQKLPIINLFIQARLLNFSRAVTWVLRLGAGEGGACFARLKGRGGSRARRTFQALINISFPKIVAGGKREKNFRTYHFPLTCRNLYNFSVIFSLIYRTFFYNYYFSKNYANIFAKLHIFLPDERVVKIAKIARQIDKTAILQHWRGVAPPPPPLHHLPRSYASEFWDSLSTRKTSARIKS